MSEFQKPIFILGSHKSGTSLLRSLFDGHQQLFTTPIETHFFQLMKYWIDYAFTRKYVPQKNITKDDFIQSTIKCIKYANSETNPKADIISKNLFDIDCFEESIELETEQIQFPNNYCAEYFEAYIKSIYYSIYQEKLLKIRIVEKSVENTEFALDLQQMFPDAYFVHIIRNPYANLISMKKFRMHNKKSKNHPWLGTDLRSLYNSYYFLYRNQRIIKNYLVVKYEDLVTNPEQTIRTICNFTEIDFSESMLSPTSLSSEWTGNSSSSQKFQGISSSHINDWQKEINALIIHLINKHFKNILRDFNYKIITSRIPLLPCNREFPVEYLANRFLWLLG